MNYKDFKKSLELNKGMKEQLEQSVDNEEDIEDIKIMNADGTWAEPQKIHHTKVGHTMEPHDDNLRRRKVKYRTEEVNNEEELDEDVATADYKVNPETGRKYRAHKINFANSKANAKPDDTPNKDEDEKEYKNSLNKEELEFTKSEKKSKKPDVKVGNDSSQLGATTGKGFDAFFNEEADDSDVSEEDLEKMVNDLSDDDYLDAYEDDELAIIDGDTGEEIHSTIKEEIEALNEVLSRAERIKSKIRFARTKSKRERRVQIALKKHSDTKTLNRRARKLAIATMKKRLARKPLDKLTVGEKERIERIIEKRKNVINRLAMRMVPKVRKIETDRLAHKKYTKE